MSIEDGKTQESVGPTISVVPATPEDALSMLQIQKAAYLAAYPNPELGITLDDINQKTDDFTSESKVVDIQENIRKGQTSRWWIARDADKPVGFLTAKKNTGEHRISRLFVLPEYQRKGVGKKLLESSVAWLGVEEPIKLQVITHNASAREFYKGFGFTETGIGWPVKLPSGKGIPTTKMSLLPR